MRTNVYKEQILNLLQERHLLTISDIHKSIPNADYSTVFRNVEQLLKDKAIKRVLIDSKSVAYESSKESHDHFICNDCGKIESLHIQVPKKALNSKSVSDITIRGSCEQCNK